MFLDTSGGILMYFYHAEIKILNEWLYTPQEGFIPIEVSTIVSTTKILCGIFSHRLVKLVLWDHWCYKWYRCYQCYLCHWCYWCYSEPIASAKTFLGPMSKQRVIANRVIEKHFDEDVHVNCDYEDMITIEIRIMMRIWRIWHWRSWIICIGIDCSANYPCSEKSTKFSWLWNLT